ncbi:MAG: methyltransferase domain-containing protein, partial [Spirochaetaceae bacterium]|nr:methyltransferase domain-containing protein [Spirochaetaceae bacterium]
MTTILAVQSRIDSTRLPGKALLPLAGEPILARVLQSMKLVPADRYFLATDPGSAERLAPIAEQWGFECFIGPRDDVLERFCLLIQESGADRVIRATGDNPFLFHEAAAALIPEFERRRCDYITWKGLPHGSGVELFSAASLLKARAAASSYDQEHVGPALYNHPDIFRSLMLEAPPQWNFPCFRTTIDTPEDYRQAVRLASILNSEGQSSAPCSSELLRDQLCPSPENSSGRDFPFSADRIVRACGIRSRPVLCVPSVVQGRGTGHIRRCVSIASALGGDILIPENSGISNIAELLVSPALGDTALLEDFRIRNTPGRAGEYSLIVADLFSMERDGDRAGVPGARELSSLAPLAALDEGGKFHCYCDYLADIIPSSEISRRANSVNPGFITLPRNRREAFPARIDRVLVVIGGEDPAGFTVPAALTFASLGCDVDAILNAVPPGASVSSASPVRWLKEVPCLREKLAEYDLVVTHYGFTAFEAAAANCAVLLLATTPLHEKLSRSLGFTVLRPRDMSPKVFSGFIEEPRKLLPAEHDTAPHSGAALSPDIRGAKAADTISAGNLAGFIASLAAGKRILCPLCGLGTGAGNHTFGEDPVEARFPDRTIRRCRRCGMLYLSWVQQGDTEYNTAYFFEEYKKQYGKTYLEDFDSIKEQGLRRMGYIESALGSPRQAGAEKRRRNGKPALLDIGCAYGPFLSAAAEYGWEPYGTDISPEAVRYVTDTLHLPASVSEFAEFDPASAFGRLTFDAVTMWYVIEHFDNLVPVLDKISSMLKTGGIFAFSTPSASGVTGRFSAETFFRESPRDHFTLWQPEKTARILKRWGFARYRILSTGHHAERFPKKGRGSLLRRTFGDGKTL